MATLLTIGEFSRMTHLSVKALRHYDDLGLLTPAEVDPASGYRRYAVAQVPVAHAIRRFRDLDMPLDLIKRILTTGDPERRDEAMVEHLRDMEARLDRTQAAVASLRGLLDGGTTAAVELRTLPTIGALAIRDQVRWDDAEEWLDGALRELGAAVDPKARAGPDGALYTPAFFEAHDGEVVAFVPVRRRPAAAGRAAPVTVPGGPYAVMVHAGPFATLDTTYGALGTFVTERAIGAGGPLREHYCVSGADSDDPSEWRTEVCWPVRSTDAST